MSFVLCPLSFAVSHLQLSPHPPLSPSPHHPITPSPPLPLSHPMPTPPYPQPEFQRELRLGLVVYGGVSLAVYMNGICREFYNAVRGRGIYKLVKALTDADLVVDIISGTSAGGINGILLSYALANSSAEEVVDFAPFGRVWRESGNIRNLLHHPSEKERDRKSLLDGEDYYQNELETALREAQQQRKPAPPDEWNSPLKELDLFVTGTDLLGRIYSVFDDTGAAIEVKDHRTLFHLKHRRGRKTPFSPTRDRADLTYKSLAKLCRITSCFPAAFPTVTVQLDDEEETADRALVEWGILNRRLLPKIRPDKGYRLHFVDGGVLDNRPFAPTIKTMYYRMANRPVERKLFYIDPSPDRFSGSPVFEEMRQPNVWQVVQESLVGMPTYESIANDLESIKERNAKVQRYNSLLADAELPISAQGELGSSSAVDLQEGIYLLSRLISLRDRVLPLVLGMGQSRTSILNSQSSEKQVLLQKVAKLLILPISQREKIDAQQTLRQVSEQIREVDVDYALRKHFYIIQKLHHLLERVRNVTELPKIRLLLERLNRQVKVLEAIRSALNSLLSHSEITRYFDRLVLENPILESDRELRDRIYYLLMSFHCILLDADGQELAALQDEQGLENAYNLPFLFQSLPAQAKLLSVTSDYEKLSPEVVNWLPQTQISGILEQLNQKIEGLERNFSRIFQSSSLEVRGNNEHSFLRSIELASQILIERSQLKNVDYLLDCFRDFRNLDKILYPFEYLTDLAEKNPIETIRISPEDAQRGLGKGKGLNEKLAGNALAAFGGFFKKSWRSNDILWGRLDGVNRLVEATLNRQSLSHFPRFLRRQARKRGIEDGTPEFEVFKQDYFEFLIESSFPKIAENDAAKLKAHLAVLAQPGSDLSDEQLSQILDDFILQGHREIIDSDLLAVIQDEIAEQIDWNYQAVEPKNRSKTGDIVDKEPKPRYNLERGYFENTASVLATAAIAQQALDDFPQSKEEFFRNKYRVGKETLWDNVPPLVLLNLAARSLLVLRDLFNTSLGKKGDRIRKSLPYTLINRLLKLFYGWLQLKGPFALKSPEFRRQTRSRLLVQLLQIALVFSIVICIIFIAANSPGLVVAVFILTAIGWLLGSPWKR
ncbi:MAG: patatin-like protein [Cyanobacteriota bacterium]|nr:patatin-like protein [Cyanobacteriota bacterium]